VTRSSEELKTQPADALVAHRQSLARKRNNSRPTRSSIAPRSHDGDMRDKSDLKAALSAQPLQQTQRSPRHQSSTYLLKPKFAWMFRIREAEPEMTIRNQHFRARNEPVESKLIPPPLPTIPPRPFNWLPVDSSSFPEKHRSKATTAGNSRVVADTSGLTLAARSRGTFASRST
jgi:hypothetical protein